MFEALRLKALEPKNKSLFFLKIYLEIVFYLNYINLLTTNFINFKN